MKEYKVIINKEGTKRYFKPNTAIQHNENGPAVEYLDGTKYWYINDKLHREDGPAIEYVNGDKVWYINDILHREDGPAIEYANGDKVWYINGIRHREDGPAIEYPDGTKYWYINGKRLSESKFNNRNKVELTLDEIAKKFNINVNQLKIKK